MVFSTLCALFNILDKVQISNSPTLVTALALIFWAALDSPHIWVNTVHVCQCWISILQHYMAVFAPFSVPMGYRSVRDQIIIEDGFSSYEADVSLLSPWLFDIQ